MTKIITAILIMLSFSASAQSVFYFVERDDQLGTMLLSLGQKNLWPTDGNVNLFKKRLEIKNPSKIYPGMKLKMNEADILFKKNIHVTNGNFTIIRKITTMTEYDELLKNENYVEQKIKSQPKPKPIKIEVVSLPSQTQPTAPIKEATTHSLNLYPGIGFFLANNKETDRLTSTSTFTGLQPMIELKAIYSNSIFGSLSIDLLTKKIIQKDFNFPINFDYRLQYIPIWNSSHYLRVAVSHSTLAHSYVGKSSNTDIKYKLKSNFVGLGLVVPRDHYWFELYFEKAYSGETSSSESTQNASKGFRVDTEMVYPITEKLRILPGINYYNLKQNNTKYELSVLELRLNVAREFEF